MDGSNGLISRLSSGLASMSLLASRTKPAASTSAITDASSIRCSVSNDIEAGTGNRVVIHHDVDAAWPQGLEHAGIHGDAIRPVPSGVMVEQHHEDRVQRTVDIVAERLDG